MAGLRKITCLITTLVVLALASSCKPFTETFDGLKSSNPISGLIPSTAGPIGKLNGLLYSPWSLVTPGPLNGIKAYSSPNVAGIALTGTVTSTLSSIVDGNGVKVTLFPTGSIIAADYRAFKLSSLYYACKLYDANTVVNTAQPCTLSAVGYDRDGKTINEVTFSYPPDNYIAADMIKKSFGTQLDGAYGINISVVGAGSGSALANVNIDNVEWCGYT